MTRTSAPTPTSPPASAGIEAEVDALYGVKFAESEVLLNGEKDPGNRTEETNLGDLVADAMLWYAMEQGNLGVDDDHVVAVTNGGGIRAHRQRRRHHQGGHPDPCCPSATPSPT